MKERLGGFHYPLFRVLAIGTLLLASCDWGTPEVVPTPAPSSTPLPTLEPTPTPDPCEGYPESLIIEAEDSAASPLALIYAKIIPPSDIDKCYPLMTVNQKGPYRSVDLFNRTVPCPIKEGDTVCAGNKYNIDKLRENCGK